MIKLLKHQIIEIYLLLNLTKEVTEKFYKDCKTLNCLNPSLEPKATDHVDGMIEMTKKLISKKAAYEISGHVFFQLPRLKIMENYLIKILQSLKRVQE